MLSANEARKKSEDLTNKANATTLRILERKIEEAIVDGKRVIYVHSLNITQEVKKYMENLGYKHNSFYDQRDNYSSETFTW